MLDQTPPSSGARSPEGPSQWGEGPSGCAENLKNTGWVEVDAETRQRVLQEQIDMLLAGGRFPDAEERRRLFFRWEMRRALQGTE